MMNLKKYFLIPFIFGIFFLPSNTDAAKKINVERNSDVDFSSEEVQNSDERYFIPRLSTVEDSEDSTKKKIRRSTKKSKQTDEKTVEQKSNRKKIKIDETDKPAVETQKTEYRSVEIAPGLIEKFFVHNDGSDRIRAYCLIADHERYSMTPMVALGKIPGRATVSDMFRDYNSWTDSKHKAVAAVNASYFATNGDLIGITKIDGMSAGTNYIDRSAVGIMEDGSMIFGKNYYYGVVTLGNVSQPVSGVDHERSENNLIIYNRWYGETTKTNSYGMEYVIEDGRVTAINLSNSRIPKNGVVVSVHGTAKDAFAGVRIGDSATIIEDYGEPWNDAVHIVGAGPRLVMNGNIFVTVDEEQFPNDIRIGAAPRSAVGVTKDGDYLIAVVDGRQRSSRGCTLTEWASILINFGAVDAINLDGGGSSTLVINGSVINSPSDGRQRPVGSSLIIHRK